MSEARLLREAFAAVAGFDAVERAERFRFGPGYNPYRDSHGKFAPGPHAPREEEGEGGGGHGGGGVATAVKTRGGKASGKATAKATSGEKTLEQHTHEQLKGIAKESGAKVGKTETHVQQHLDLLTLHPHLQQAVDEGRLNFGLVRDLAKLTPEHQSAVAEHILSNDLGLRGAKAAIRAYQEREAQTEMFPHGMFPSIHVATKTETDAHAKYQDAIAQITKHLSGLDDETMRNMARVVPSPGKESQRLDLMAKQLRRMQKILDTAEQQRNLFSELSDREYQRLIALMRRDVRTLHEAVDAERRRLHEGQRS